MRQPPAGHRRARAAAQGGPAPDHGPRRATSMTSRSRAAVGRVRALARGARQDRLDRHARRPASAHGVHAVFTGEDMARSRRRRCRWPGCRPGVEVNIPEHWPLARGEVKHVGDPVAVVRRRGPLRGRGRGRGRARRVRPAAGRRRPRGGARGRRAARPRAVRHQQGPSSGRSAGGDLDAGFADADVVVERRVVNHRIAGARDRAARRAGRVPRRQADAVERRRRSRTSCGCSWRSCSASSEERCASSRPRSAAASARSCRSTARRSSSRWASRKLGRPVKWIETRSESDDGHPPGPRPDRLRADGRQARRHDHRAPRQDHRRPAAPTTCS